MSKRPTKIKATEALDTNEGRLRQSKRDEAIRKKLEQEFSKKRPSNSSRTLRQNRRLAGTVSALRPGQALTVKESMLVVESAQLMAAKRCDCVLVVNENDHLSGIFTAKDIAYRVVAGGLDARTTPVIDIMTKNPMCVTSDTSATEALNLMVSKGFRHLPVCNEDGDIFGLLDITKCLYEALEKMERAFGSSQKLYDALEEANQLNGYMEDLRDKMSCPNLGSILDGTPPAEVKYKTNVKEIAILMKELHTTAVLVTRHHTLAGIFTSKDIVLRVIAAGLNPENCTVVRVMTPNPDTASPETTVLDALKRMNDGHYLNLPVLEGGIVTGMVDVLKLTYTTLEQMNSIQGSDGQGPMWSRFWDSFGGPDHTDSGSQLSEHSHLLQQQQHLLNLPNGPSPQSSTSLSQLKSYSDISPNESASMVNSVTPSVLPETFTFKFSSLQNKTHRVVCKPVYHELFEAVRFKIESEHVETDKDDEREWLSISYLDDEDDKVLVSCDADVADAVHLAQKQKQNRVLLFVQDQNAQQVPVEKVVETRRDDNNIDAVEEAPPAPVPAPVKKSNPLLLPAAIGFLGAVIVGVVVLSKTQNKK
ncbi:CBS-domain-containing protein [Backusella circina FSU 941]|nr:CBS-domain-containing protein [Backusella circina FSU 941]